MLNRFIRWCRPNRFQLVNFRMESTATANELNIARQLRHPKPEPNGKRRIFLGTIIHSLELGKLECLNPGMLAVDARGEILFCDALPTELNWDNKNKNMNRQVVETEVAKKLASLGPPQDEKQAMQNNNVPPPLSTDSRFKPNGDRIHYAISDFEWVDLGPRLLIPGFVDGHVHACQYGYMVSE